MKDNKERVVTIRLKHKVYHRLKIVAARLGVTLSGAVENLLSRK